ncbi:hypothetical protein PR048_001850 [Dryococelus australis]|uniref:Uncharacterized protein n=1 Tax=Dryococelus australis TaxID=614101 RepID=A0ABQ9IIM0_9NEOP|nr:hypothetical protein PR048_001850 [Dryococelus australis]
MLRTYGEVCKSVHKLKGKVRRTTVEISESAPNITGNIRRKGRENISHLSLDMRRSLAISVRGQVTWTELVLQKEQRHTKSKNVGSGQGHLGGDKTHRLSDVAQVTENKVDSLYSLFQTNMKVNR